ncbi:hypothetical protein ABZ490_36330 [Streptomyces sp. NPDC005811]|uniref:hypothetical protein n=1 Tax=Streptomyces sp. NPDC005811 TaxID=3154565 RepID=UPI00340F8299
MLALVSPANAAANIRGVEPFNTDKLLMSLCTGSTSQQYWLINVQTGELKKSNAFEASHLNALSANWEAFEGSCSYPESSSWTWTGPETKVSNTLVNCSSGSQLSQNLQTNGSTTSTETNSVSGSFGFDWNAIKDVLHIQAGGAYEHTWSYAKAKGWSTTTGITVPPRRVGWLTLRPEMRTVRSNPRFTVSKYRWGASGGGLVTTTTWRGRDSSYKTILSTGAYYDAKANVINPDGTPKGQNVARDRAVASSDHC